MAAERAIGWALVLASASACAPSAPHLCDDDAEPTSFVDFVDHLAGLPEPTAACMVRSLRAPLSVVATSNPFSAQPAQGEEAPRIFLLSGPIVLTFATAGRGIDVVEFSEQTGPNRSIKGELPLPLPSIVDVDVVNDKLTEGTPGTACRACHHGEEQTEQGLWESIAFRPSPRYPVSLDLLADAHQQCTEPDICELYDAVFASDPVPGAFPETFEVLGF